MLRFLILVLIIVPALEIMGLVAIGQVIGGWATFLLLIVSGLIGAYLVKTEARKVWNYAQFELARGHVPTQSILDGICLFAAGLLLITPGFFTDVLGFLLVLPFTRPILRTLLLLLIKKWIDRGIYIRFYR